MNYKIKIEKQAENPNYDSQLEAYNENNKRNMYNQKYDVLFPEKYITLNAMNVDLTEEQFKAIRKAVLDVF